MNILAARRLLEPRIWKRVWRERMTEPIHLNLVAAAVALFGSFRKRVDFDLVMRPHIAFGLLRAADWAKQYGVRHLTAIEFGVANGAGLLNMCDVAAHVTNATGVEFEIVGFDGGAGMPPPIDYRDHPEYYNSGDFPMQDQSALRRLLPKNAKLVVGDIRETVQHLDLKAPLGFVVVDVDFYSSTVDALKIFCRTPDCYLPSVVIYMDDVAFEGHNEHCGELLAIREFTDRHPLRPITRFNFLRQRRIFQRALWIEQMFMCHILDHQVRQHLLSKPGSRVLDNPYLATVERGELAQCRPG